MNQILYNARCRCKEKAVIRKSYQKPKRIRNSDIRYPLPKGLGIWSDEGEKIEMKTFQIRYEKKLSSVAKLILNSLQYKYIYFAIDDILDSFKSNPNERDNLLEILYSPVLSLQNNFFISFFDIWISEIYINEVSKINKFLKNESSNFEQCSYITITLFYRPPKLPKKPEILW